MSEGRPHVADAMKNGELDVWLLQGYAHCTREDGLSTAA